MKPVVPFYLEKTYVPSRDNPPAHDKETPTRYEPFGTFWADCVTGSLFHPNTGKCLSSDQIWMVI